MKIEKIELYENVVFRTEWETWKTHHGKNYSGVTEEKFRFKIYMENKARIARHNQAAHAGDKSYFLKMNHYGDLLHHEFRRVMNGYDYAAKKLLRAQADTDRVTWIAPENVELPAEVDWRTKGNFSFQYFLIAIINEQVVMEASKRDAYPLEQFSFD